jgi:choloylglycine hydrolase
MDSEVIFFPRGLTIQGTTTDNVENGLTWETKYVAAGVNGVGLPIIIDGLNEKGLGGGIFYFPDFAEFQDATGQSIAIEYVGGELSV